MFALTRAARCGNFLLGRFARAPVKIHATCPAIDYEFLYFFDNYNVMMADMRPYRDFAGRWDYAAFSRDHLTKPSR